MGEFFGYASRAAAQQHYAAEGYLILKGWFPDYIIEQLASQFRALWSWPRNDRLVIDFGSGPLANTRMLLKDAPDYSPNVNQKINDLFLESPAFRSIFLGGKLTELLETLIGGRVSICNSLHFTYGSGQRAHIDTWYMPPPVEDRMVVASVPLEPYTSENGPLFYYPKSHLIPKYRFSDGNIRAIEVEMPECDAYLFSEIEQRGLKKRIFIGEPGDLFIWHSQLLHGGEPAIDPLKTRRSVVVHYWRQGDIDGNDEYPWLHNVELPSDFGFYVARPHQALGEVINPQRQAAERLARSVPKLSYEDLQAQFEDLRQDRIKAQAIMEFQHTRIQELEALLQPSFSDIPQPGCVSPNPDSQPRL